MKKGKSVKLVFTPAELAAMTTEQLRAARNTAIKFGMMSAAETIAREIDTRPIRAGSVITGAEKTLISRLEERLVRVQTALKEELVDNERNWFGVTGGVKIGGARINGSVVHETYLNRVIADEGAIIRVHKATAASGLVLVVARYRLAHPGYDILSSREYTPDQAEEAFAAYVELARGVTAVTV